MSGPSVGPPGMLGSALPPDRRLVHAVLGIGFAAFFLYLAVRTVDPRELWSRLKAVNLWSVLPVLILIAAFFWLKAIRWRWLAG